MASPLVVGRVASMAMMFALPLGLARLLDARAFGGYKQLFLVSQTVVVGCQLGLTQSLYYFLPREREGRGAYVAQVLLALGVVALVVLGALVAFGPTLARHVGDGTLAPLATPLALFAALSLLATPLEAALTSDGRIGLSALAWALSEGGRAALLLLGARWGGLAGVAWAAVASAVLRVAALGACISTGTLPIAAPRREAIRAQLRYALPFAGSVWLFIAQRQLLQYAVASRFDAATFALFCVAAFHLPVVDVVYAPIGEVLMVQLGRGATAAERRAAWDDAVAKLAAILWPAAACAWLFGAAVLPMLFTARYAASVPLFMLASLEIPLWVLPVDALLRAGGRTRFVLGWYAARLGISAALVLGGMHVAGLRGAIVGGVISEALSRVVMAHAGRSLLGVGLLRVLDPALLSTAAAAAAAAIPAWAVGRLVEGKPALYAGAAVYGAAYLALRYVMRPRRPAVPVMAAAE